MRQIKLKEVEKHDSSRSLWMIIHNEVYDVTKFVDEHPGGAESLLDFAGKDGTEAFEDVGHSQDARELLKKYKIGVLPRDEQKLAPCGSSKLKWALIALAGAIIIGIALNKYAVKS